MFSPLELGFVSFDWGTLGRVMRMHMALERLSYEELASKESIKTLVNYREVKEIGSPSLSLPLPHRPCNRQRVRPCRGDLKAGIGVLEGNPKERE